MTRQLTWGILGTGNIARQFADGLAFAARSRVSAVASRQFQTAHGFAAARDIPRAYGSYEQLLADPDVEAVYISLPNSLHHAWTLRALAAGKHVLCEKPLAVNEQQAREMIEAANKAGRLLVEAFMYRTHPLTDAWLAQVRSGAIGDLRLIRTSFCFCTANPSANIRFRLELAGGALMDVGCYCLNLSRLVTGAEPENIQAQAHFHDSGVDDLTIATLQFPGGIYATFSVGMSLHADNSASIHGSRGYLTIPVPWKPPARAARYILAQSTPPRMDGPTPPPSPPQTFEVLSPGSLYGQEADRFAQSVLDGAPPAVSPQDSLGNMRCLDQIRKLIGLRFHADQD